MCRACLLADGGFAVVAAEFGQLLAIRGRRQPALDQRLVHLEVELEAVGVVAPAERLLFATGRCREVRGAVGDVEAIAMPLEHRRIATQRGQHRIGSAVFGGLQAMPADLGAFHAMDRRAQHVRQQLRAEADAEHRLALREHAFDREQFGAQVRAVDAVLDVHRSAEHDQPAIAVDVGLRFGIALEVGEADAVAATADQRIERAERLGGDVLEDEQARHAIRRRCVSADRADAWDAAGPGRRARSPCGFGANGRLPRDGGLLLSPGSARRMRNGWPET